MTMPSILLLAISMPVMAQDKATENPTPPPPCSTDKYRQFDFCIGDWNVAAKGQPAGTNSIHPVRNGCALLENWQGAGPGGISRSSLNREPQATLFGGRYEKAPAH